MNEFYSPPAFDARIEARRAEILREMEEYKCALMREMSGLDRATLTRLRSFLANHGIADVVTITRVEESLDSGGTNVVYFSDGSILCIRNGKDGDGNGAGAGITITNVSESPDSGGNNVVTFSDGTTLTIRNGKDGADGADGADGTDGTGSSTDYGLPDYWDTYLTSKIATIKDRQSGGGRNAFSYIVMTDMHYAQQKAHYTGKIAKRIMDECNIPFALSLGDNVSRGTIDDVTACDGEFNGYWGIVEPIVDKLLCTQGNHDGYYYNGSSNYYAIEDALDRVYSGMKVSTPTVWDENGTGYYVDDCANRVRYIVLNTCSRGSLTGTPPATAPYMSVFRYTQCQFDMVVEALNTIPNNRWRVVVCSHVVPIWEVDRFGDGVKVTNIESQFADASAMIKLLTAYADRTTITISHEDTLGEWANVAVTADFSNAKGTLAIYNGGHYHVDKAWAKNDIVNGDVRLGFPVVLHRCDSFNENQGSTSPTETTLENERVVGTTTEHCFDVVTVCPDNGVIYLTRIGAGNDRAISTVTDSEDDVTYHVVSSLTNVSIDNDVSTVKHGDSYYATVEANENCTLSHVQVTVGGVNNPDCVVQQGNTAQILINNVTGNIVIIASATEGEETVTTHTVTYNLTNCSSREGGYTHSVDHGNEFQDEINANEGYEIDSVTVTMGGVDCTSEYYNDGSVYIGSVTGDVVITATAVVVDDIQRWITTNLTNVNINNSATFVDDKDSYNATLTAYDGYEIDSVTVTMGGEDCTSEYYSNGIVSIGSVTGDVVITATATKTTTTTNYADPTSADWVTDSRLSGSGSSVSALEGCVVTNYIPCKLGDTIHIRGLNSLWCDSATTVSASSWFCDSSKSRIGAIQFVNNIIEGAVVCNDGDYDVSYTVGGYNPEKTNAYLPSDWSQVAYMRFCGVLNGNAEDVIITVNE